jgi:hypothetical protein
MPQAYEILIHARVIKKAGLNVRHNFRRHGRISERAADPII